MMGMLAPVTGPLSNGDDKHQAPSASTRVTYLLPDALKGDQQFVTLASMLQAELDTMPPDQAIAYLESNEAWLAHPELASKNGNGTGDGVHLPPKEDKALTRRRPWVERSPDLAVHFEKYWMVRADCFGGYYTDADGKVKTTTTSGPNGEKIPLTQGIILHHCRASTAKDVIGLHTTRWMPVEGTGGGGVSVTRSMSVDIDFHDKDKDSDPEANRRAALAWNGVLAGLGFHPLLTDSNGRGGFHLRVLFDEPIWARHSRQLGRWLIRDWKDHGLAGCPEVFPKQDEVTAPGSKSGSYGGWLRLPGRHPKRDFWSRAWDGDEFVGGHDAIDIILDHKGDSPQLIPAECLAFDPELRAAGNPGPRVRSDEELDGEAGKAREALTYLGPGKKDKQGREYLSDYEHWLKIGMALHELGDIGFGLWLDWSRQCPDKFDEEVCTYKWSTFTDEGEKRVRLATLFKLATNMGRLGPWRDEAPDGGDSKPASGYICGRKGEPISCPNNTKVWLGLKRPADHVRYDRFRQAILLGGIPLTDQAVIDLTMDIEASLRTPWSQEHVRSALVHLAHQRPFSSVVEWLESLRWDGTERVNAFFSKHFKSEDTPYTRECGRVFFISATARAFEPGCQADIMPVLIGPQGRFKSTGMAALCPDPDWFADDLGCDLFAGKAAEGLQGKWIFEFGEFARINRSTLDVVKSFITRRVDRYRPPYGRIAQDFPRGCVFFGTTNSQQPLQDIENRRFFPIQVVQGDVAGIVSARDQLWAEAAHRYRAGEKWHVTSSNLLQEISSNVESARSSDAWEAILEDKLIGRVRTTMVEAAGLLGLWHDGSQGIVNKLGRPEQTRIGLALAAIGFRSQRESTGARERFYEREIRPTSEGK